MVLTVPAGAVARTGMVTASTGRRGNWPIPPAGETMLTSRELPLTEAIPIASPCGLKTATREMGPKTAGSNCITSRPEETSCGVVDQTLICAHPPGGAVSLEIWRVRFAAGSGPARRAKRTSCIGTTQRETRRDCSFSMMEQSNGGTCTPRSAARPSCARKDRPGGLSHQFLKPGAEADDGLIPFGAGGDAAHLNARARLQKRDVLLRLGRQLVVVSDAERGYAPPGHVLVHGLDLRNLGHRSRHTTHFPAPDAITDADRNRVEFVQHVELGHHDAVETDPIPVCVGYRD